MNYLYNATKNWVNITNMTMNYLDEVNSDSYGYGGIKTTGNKTSIFKKDNVVTATYENLKVRMPYKSEVSNYSSSLNNGYLYENLNCIPEISYCVEGVPHISGIPGYWIFSSTTMPKYAYKIHYRGVLEIMDQVSMRSFGVRPVINIKL